MSIDEREHLDRDTLIKIASELFTERGYDATSMRDLAEAAGCTKSTLYHHVRSKADLLVSIHDEFTDAMFRALEADAPSDGWDHDPATSIRILTRIAFRTLHEYSTYVRIFHREIAAIPPEHATRVLSRRKEYEGFVIARIQHGIECGQFNAHVPADVTARVFFGACNWASEWYQPGRARGWSELADYFADVLLNGMCDPPSVSNEIDPHCEWPGNRAPTSSHS